MRRTATRLTKKGQVTIPVEIRTKLGLRPSDRVYFEVDGDAVRIRPAESDIDRWYGSVVPPEGFSYDIESAREAYERSVAEDAIRPLRE